MRPLALCACLLALPAACGGDDAANPDAGDVADATDDFGDAGPDAAGNPDATTGCPRTLGPADRTRKLVASRPYADNGGVTYDVFDLTTDGTLTATGDSFTMGRAFLGEIAFTADGEVGLVVQDSGDDQGTVGVFRFDGDGHPVIVDAAFDGGGAFYAERVVMAADGAHAYILDSEWANIGGGVYRVAIECDGSLTFEGKVAEAKLPYTMNLFAGEQRALVAADDILGTGVDSGNSLYLLDWSGPPQVIEGVKAFGDDESIVSSAGLTHDGKYLLLGDADQYSGVGNRVAAVEVTENDLFPTQILTSIEDPIAILTSPDDDAALVVTGMGDAVILFDYAPAGEPPFENLGEIDYADATGSQLPSGAVMLERGTLRGRVLVAELAGVRQIQFDGDGTVTDHGVTDLGVGGAPGAIGIQP